jgi:hypothetical protein
MRYGFALLAVAFASAPWALAQSAPERGAYRAAETTSTPLPRGAHQTWAWTAPSGSYMAFVRVNFRLHAPNHGEGGYSMKGDSRLQCRIFGEGGQGGYDEASAYVGADQAGTTFPNPAFSTGSDDESFALVTAVAQSYGTQPTKISLRCDNTTISTEAGPIMIDKIFVNLVPVASINLLEALPVVAVPAPAPAAPPTPAAPTKPVTPKKPVPTKPK